MTDDKLERGIEIFSNSKTYQWCYVNTDNEFKFMDGVFKISEDVTEYKVYKKAGTVEDFTNEAFMEEILVVVDENDTLKFYNQNFDHINNEDIKTLKKSVRRGE